MKKLNIIVTAILFAITTTGAFAQTKTKVTFGGNTAYHFGGGQSDVNTPFMFLKNGQSAGLDLTLVPKTGTTRYKFAVDYFTGTTDNAAIADYVKNSKIAYDSFSLSKSKPSGVSVMVSPQFMLFPKSTNKKLPLMWLDLKAGVMISNQQRLQFFLDSNSPSTEIKTKAMSFVYNPSLVVNVASIKGMFINVRAGYSNYGGFSLGINITEQDCRGAMCERCPNAGCIPFTKPKAN